MNGVDSTSHEMTSEKVVEAAARIWARLTQTQRTMVRVRMAGTRSQPMPSHPALPELGLQVFLFNAGDAADAATIHLAWREDWAKARDLIILAQHGAGA